MIVVFDNNYLVYLIQGVGKKSVVKDVRTKKDVDRVQEKIGALIKSMAKRRDKILIPTPVLAEIITKFPSNTNALINALKQDYNMQFADFNVLAAIEAGIALNVDKLGRKQKDSRQSWQKVKFDRQIVSIAKVNKADAVYTNDKQVVSWTEILGMTAVTPGDLPPPPPHQSDINEISESDAGDEGGENEGAAEDDT